VEEVSVPPEPALMESMRSVGYTLATSIADVIDNSVAAEARHVWIDFVSEGDRYVTICDDGHGMDETMAVNAMRLAATNPRAVRHANDLGRFGLGLKTASLAQCRVLTVVSRSGSGLVAVQWNLDHLAAAGTWALLKLDDNEIQGLPGIRRLDDLLHGTLVIWQNLDLLESTVGADPAAIDQAMTSARDHLALVFHRFISGEDRPALKIVMNGTLLPALDPFLTNNRATQQSYEESFQVEGQDVRVKAFTLPFLSKMTKKDKETALVAGTLRDSQGFYIYRAGRLVIWGEWFRLEKRSDLSKLARVRVDIPNTLDHLWSLDIKKSAAIPPPAVRFQLKRLSERMVKPSKRVQAFRGRPISDPVTRLWDTIEDRDTFRYSVNRTHPVIQAMEHRLDVHGQSSLEALLTSLEDSFPVFDAHNRLSQDQSLSTDVDSEAAALTQALDLLAAHRSLGGNLTDFISIYSSIEPLNQIVNLAEKLLLNDVDDS
jgi:hypothetical protein